MRSTGLVAFLPLLLGGCVRPFPRVESQELREASPLEYDVYAVLVAAEASDAADAVIVLDSTSAPSRSNLHHDFIMRREDIPREFHGAYWNLMAKNGKYGTRVALPDDPTRGIKVGSCRTIDGLKSELGIVHRLAFSRVGFNHNSTTAVVFRGLSCGKQCGDLSLVLLERPPDGEWSIRRSILIGEA